MDEANEEMEVPERVQFDIAIPAAHRYLPDTGHQVQIDDGIGCKNEFFLTVRLLKLPVILLPTQVLPYFTHHPDEINIIEEAFSKQEPVAVKPFFMDNVELNSNIGTLIKIKKFGELNQGKYFEALAISKCQFISEIFNGPRGEVLVEVMILNDFELVSLTQLQGPSTISRLSFEHSGLYLSALTAHPFFVHRKFMKEVLANELMLWLKGKTDISELKELSKEDISKFSYRVATNIPIELRTQLSLLKEPNSYRRLNLLKDIIKRSERIVCNGCEITLASVSDTLNLSTAGVYAHYVNQGGYVYNILTFRRIESGIPHGEPSSDFSWFPGYSWQIYICSRCHHHVGWKFNSFTLEPSFFYAFTLSSVKIFDDKGPLRI